LSECALEVFSRRNPSNHQSELPSIVTSHR
jgi:hypothetical protein